MILSKITTLLDIAKDTTIEEFKNSTSLDVATTEYTTINKGDIVFRIAPNRTAFTSLISRNGATCLNITSRVDNHEGMDLLRATTDKVININANTNFTDCMAIIEQYRTAAGTHFYGALLRSADDSSIIINPYHILTALAVLESPEYLTNVNYNIIIYIYNNREHADKQFESHLANADLMLANIEKLMQIYATKVQTTTKIVSSTYDETRQRIKTRFQESIDHDEDKSYAYDIVLHQLSTNGIISPFYGTSAIKTSRDKSHVEGLHLSPFKSCNINGRSSSTPNIAAEGYAVCTGSIPANTIEGLRTLTHSYLGSPHESQNIVPGALIYADIMISKAVDLYTAAEIIKTAEVVIEEELPTEEPHEFMFSEEQRSYSSFKTYKELYRLPNGKYQFTLAAIKIEYNEMKKEKELHGKKEK